MNEQEPKNLKAWVHWKKAEIMRSPNAIGYEDDVQWISEIESAVAAQEREAKLQAELEKLQALNLAGEEGARVILAALTKEQIKNAKLRGVVDQGRRLLSKYGPYPCKCRDRALLDRCECGQKVIAEFLAESANGYEYLKGKARLE